MEYIGKFISNFREYYNGINAATLTGAIDVVIVQQEDGTFLSSPFHVRFGKLGVLRSRQKVVDIEINGDPVDIHMKLGESGEAFFVGEPMVDDSDVPSYLATSPIPMSNMEDNFLFHERQAMEEVHTMTNIKEEDKCDDVMDVDEHQQLHADDSSDPSKSIGSSGQPVVFKAETVIGSEMDLPFKPIDPDLEPAVVVPEVAEVAPLVLPKKQSLPDLFGSTRAEEESKRLKKKSRKRRKKKCHEQFRLSSESDAADYTFELDEELDVELQSENNSPADHNHGKLGHRKSHSFAGIQVEMKEEAPACSDNADAIENWVHSGMKSRSIGPEFHFFSDTEVEVRSPTQSRPSTPIHSDTEYEVGIQRQNASSTQEAESPRQSWRWGELPSPPVNRPSPPKTMARACRDSSPNSINNKREKRGDADGVTPGRSAESGRNDNGRPAQTPEEEEVQRSMLSHMFSFMRQSKKIRSQAAAAGGGIYLDDLNVDALDPELARLYITQSSFHQKLHSSEMNCASRSCDEDTESGRGQSLPHSPSSLSTRMHQSSGPRSIDSDFEDSRHEFQHPPEVALSLCGLNFEGSEPPEEMFLQSLVTYDDFVMNPRLMENPDLVVKIGDKYYRWDAACPIIMSWALYQRVLPQSVVDSIVHDSSVKQREEEKEKKKNETPPTRSSYSWFPWRNRGSQKATPEKTDSTTNTGDLLSETETDGGGGVGGGSSTGSGVGVGDGRVRHSTTTGTSSENDSDSTGPGSAKKLPLEKRTYYESPDVYCKTLRLTSEQIAKWNLREGPNEAVFSVTTAYQGTTRCRCHIYLWRYDDRVVISDIDGTITKSDVLGHILPIVGQDWAQSGVAQLFTKIRNNGYRILYLSARAIGHAHITREYLRSVRQGDLSLPDGPLLLNPTSLLSALHREVIEKKPEEFKISCLRDIQCLFPSSTNPFYAGYGNKVNDVWAYRAVGIPTSRIFTINPRGELKLELSQSFQSSYSKQSFIVDLVFPPLTDGVEQREALEGTDYNEFAFWRTPVAELPDEATKFITDYSDVNASK